ncbi:hypothetical protein V5O48_000581 [Marasmius crinis-equi]|uniref:BZIP domain-containing protein n=1 Tax=Marasmius crinis-equi TaxID=585013 RepID=A0ABR3G0T8_9AGAR
MATNTIETAPQKDATTMDKDAQALQSVVDTLMGTYTLCAASIVSMSHMLNDTTASPEFRNLPTMNSPALTSPNSFLTSPFDTPLQQFDTSPIIDFADTFDGTSPMDTPLFDEFNTSPIDDSPFLDVLNTPVMDGVDGLEMYTTGGPLFDDGGVGMYEELEQVVKQPAPTTAATEVQWDALLKMSPQTAALDPALVYPSPSVASEHAFPALPAPQEAAPAPSPAPSALPTRRKQPSATGTRRNITPESLVPYDAPTQTRRYAMPSATSKKEVPATFARKKRKAMGGDAVAVDVGDDQLDDAELPPLKPDATEVEQIEYKRRQNTLAARKSRKRKLEYQQGIEVENSELKREVEVWKTRCELLSGMLKGAGINVDVQALAASKISNNIAIEDDLSKAFPGISEEQLWVKLPFVSRGLDTALTIHITQDRPPIGNVIKDQAIKTDEKDQHGDYRYKCKTHGELDCRTCFDWSKRVVQEFLRVAATIGKEVPPETTREDKLGLLAAMGVKLPSTTLLAEEAIDKKVKGALDAAQSFSRVMGEKEINPESLPVWTRDGGVSLPLAVRRDSVAEVSGFRGGPFPLYENALVDLRTSITSIASAIEDPGICHFVMQDKDQASAICFRVIDVRKVGTVPMIAILYNRTTRNRDIGDIPAWLQEPLGAKKLLQITATLEEQLLVLSFLHLNSKRLVSDYRPARTGPERHFVPSFILPVGSISQIDLGRLSSHSGTETEIALHSSVECQKAHWREHKPLCKSLSGGTWQTVTFSIEPEADPHVQTSSGRDGASSEGALRYLNVQTPFNVASDTFFDLAHEAPAGCPNIHGDYVFLIKIQRNRNGDKLPMLVYDRQRSLQVHLNYKDDPESHAKTLEQMKSALKMYRWARRVGELQLAVCLDRAPVEDPSW